MRKITIQGKIKFVVAELPTILIKHLKRTKRLQQIVIFTSFSKNLARFQFRSQNTVLNYRFDRLHFKTKINSSCLVMQTHPRGQLPLSIADCDFFINGCRHRLGLPCW